MTCLDEQTAADYEAKLDLLRAELALAKGELDEARESLSYARRHAEAEPDRAAVDEQIEHQVARGLEMAAKEARSERPQWDQCLAYLGELSIVVRALAGLPAVPLASPNRAREEALISAAWSGHRPYEAVIFLRNSELQRALHVRDGQLPSVPAVSAVPLSNGDVRQRLMDEIFAQVDRSHPVDGRPERGRSERERALVRAGALHAGAYEDGPPTDQLCDAMIVAVDLALRAKV
jgi:hypothetical protein